MVRLPDAAPESRSHAAAGAGARSKLTVLLVDDHALVRHGFRRILEDDPEIAAVVGEASNGEEAVASGEARESRPGDCDGLRDAGNEWFGSDAENPGGQAGCGNFDVEHAFRGHPGAAGAGRGSARIHIEKRDGP